MLCVDAIGAAGLVPHGLDGVGVRVGFGLGLFGFGGLGGSGEVEVLLHGLAGERGVTRSDGAEDLAVHLGGFLEVLGVLDGLGAKLVEIGGDGLHQGTEDGIASGAGDGAMETDVVDEIFLGVGEGGVHLGDLFGQLGDVLVGGALGGEGCYGGFEDETGFKHLPGKDAVESSQDREGAGVESGRTAGDEGSCAVAAFEYAHGGKKTDSRTEAGTADLELASQLALGRKAVPGFNLSGGDKGTNVLDDLHRELAVRGCVGGGLFFHFGTGSSLGKWEKGNTEGGGTAKTRKGIGVFWKR